jgi:hypothetical protein
MRKLTAILISTGTGILPSIRAGLNIQPHAQRTNHTYVLRISLRVYDRSNDTDSLVLGPRCPFGIVRVDGVYQNRVRNISSRLVNTGGRVLVPLPVVASESKTHDTATGSWSRRRSLIETGTG